MHFIMEKKLDAFEDAIRTDYTTGERDFLFCSQNENHLLRFNIHESNKDLLVRQYSADLWFI